MRCAAATHCTSSMQAFAVELHLLTPAPFGLRVRPLVYLVKLWAKRRKIHEPYKGYLSSYTYTLLVIHYLQREGVLVCLQVAPLSLMLRRRSRSSPHVPQTADMKRHASHPTLIFHSCMRVLVRPSVLAPRQHGLPPQQATASRLAGCLTTNLLAHRLSLAVLLMRLHRSQCCTLLAHAYTISLQELGRGDAQAEGNPHLTVLAASLHPHPLVFRHVNASRPS